MPVIAGTTKESVINKAREVLREKEIPYTIKRTKTWFWVSSTKPTAAQTALREAGLEMNPITTMHSIWCRKCNAIRTFKKKGTSWVCQKCGAKLSIANPKKVKAMVHPEALESLARYKDDLKAGHTSAAEYWRGQAGAYFTANPKKYSAKLSKILGRKVEILPPGGDVFWSKPARDMTQILITFGGFNKKELVNRLIQKVTLRNKLIQERHVLQVAQEMRDEYGSKIKGNPDFLRKTIEQRRAGYALGKELGLSPAMARRTRDWRSPKVFRMLGLPVPPLSERRAMGLVNPLTAQEKREITNLANTQFAISRKYSDDPVRSSFWYGRSVGMGKIAKMYNPKVRKWDPISEILEGDEEEDNMIGAEINPSEMTRMLKTLVTKSDLKEIKNALGTPKIGDVLRKVCRRRGLRNTLQVYSALIGLTGTKLNPLGAFICGRCGKRFHSMEALNIHLLKIHKVSNPLTQFCCSICETCAPKRLLPHSKFPERMRWLRHHYMRKHPGLWPWTRRGNPISRELEYELEQFIRKPKLPKIEERIRLAKKFLRERGEPTDMPRVLIATKSLEDLYKSEHKNPLTAIGSATLAGVGLGIGFKSVDWMAKKIKKNPRRR